MKKSKTEACLKTKKGGFSTLFIDALLVAIAIATSCDGNIKDTGVAEDAGQNTDFIFILAAEKLYLGTDSIAPGGMIGNFTAPAGGAAPFRYELALGEDNTDNELFEIMADTLNVKEDGSGPLTAGGYSVRVRATDAAGKAVSKVFTFQVTAPPLAAEIINNPADLAEYIEDYCMGGTTAAPAVMKFSGAITQANLATVRSKLNVIDTYVIWDLSEVTGGLTGVQIGDTIDDDADTGRDKIKGLVLPANLTTIGTSAFQRCASLTNISLPLGLTSIDVGAFDDCASLEDIILPASLNSIGKMAFHGCTNLTFIADTEVWTTVHGGEILIKDGNTVIAGPGVSIDHLDLSLLQDISAIDDRAFMDVTILKMTTLPENLTSIGIHAFYGCTGLETVVFNGDNVNIVAAASFPGTGTNLKAAYETGKQGVGKGVAGTYIYGFGGWSR